MLVERKAQAQFQGMWKKPHDIETLHRSTQSYCKFLFFFLEYLDCGLDKFGNGSGTTTNSTVLRLPNYVLSMEMATPIRPFLIVEIRERDRKTIQQLVALVVEHETVGKELATKGTLQLLLMVSLF